MLPATMTVSNVRPRNDDVWISYPSEVATGPPFSETSKTSYAADPTFQFAVSNTLVTPKFIGETAGYKIKPILCIDLPRMRTWIRNVPKRCLFVICEIGPKARIRTGIKIVAGRRNRPLPDRWMVRGSQNEFHAAQI